MTSQILRVSIKGELPGGEVWSTNPCWEIDGSGGQLVTPGDCQTIATALAAITVPSFLLALMAPGSKVNGYRVEARRITGPLEAQGEASRSTPANGAGPSVHPHTMALVLSLRTTGVGASSRGRMYWPATGIALQSSDYRVATADVTAALTAFKTYLSGMETAIKVTLPNANLTVWSRQGATFHNVNAIQMGNVPDSQRRRKDALAEGYSAVAFP